MSASFLQMAVPIPPVPPVTNATRAVMWGILFSAGQWRSATILDIVGVSSVVQCSEFYRTGARQALPVESGLRLDQEISGVAFLRVRYRSLPERSPRQTQCRHGVIRIDRDGGRRLGQFHAQRIDDQRQMQVARRGQAEGALQE